MTTKPARRIVYTPLDELVPARRNPKRHADLTPSLEAFGYLEPVMVDERTGRLVGGHGRLETLQAWQDAGRQPPDGVQLRGTRWYVPVVRGWSSVDDSHADAALVALNRYTELGGWHTPDLAELLQALPDVDDHPLLTAAGWTPAQLQHLTVDLPTDDNNGDGGRDLDAAPPVPTAAIVTKPGDTWQLGRHTIVCGDATIAEQAAAAGAHDATLLLTDPPYCSGGFQESGRAAGSVGTAAKHKQVANDRLSTRGYMALLKATVSQTRAPFVYVFTDWRMWIHLFDVLESCGFGVRSMIVWDKGTPGMGRGWRSQHELIGWAAKSTPPFNKHAPGNGNVIQAHRTGNPLHTTQKPVDLLVRLLEAVPFADVVYDPMAGSGSTLIAAHETGRTARLLELDPAYVDVVCRRYQQHTGDKPKRAGRVHDFTEGGD